MFCAVFCKDALWIISLTKTRSEWSVTVDFLAKQTLDRY